MDYEIVRTKEDRSKLIQEMRKWDNDCDPDIHVPSIVFWWTTESNGYPTVTYLDLSRESLLDWAERLA